MASILTKFGGNDDNPTLNATVTLEMHFTETKDGGRRQLEFRKSVVTSLLVDQSSPNFI